MRRVIPLLLSIWLTATAMASCTRQVVRHRKVTGTCAGVCRHYLVCKNNHTKKMMKICVAECDEMFSGVEAHKAFERHLDCEEAISFVEGKSGRGPGSTP